MTKNIQVGDKVRVRFGIIDEAGIVLFVFDDGNNNVTLRNHLPTGKSYFIKMDSYFDLHKNDKSVHCNFSHFVWPDSCVSQIPEPIKIGDGKFDVFVVNGKTVKVGCQTITKEQIEQVLAAMEAFKL